VSDLEKKHDLVCGVSHACTQFTNTEVQFAKLGASHNPPARAERINEKKAGFRLLSHMNVRPQRTATGALPRAACGARRAVPAAPGARRPPRVYYTPYRGPGAWPGAGGELVRDARGRRERRAVWEMR
jgi:hypothetical protein